MKIEIKPAGIDDLLQVEQQIQVQHRDSELR